MSNHAPDDPIKEIINDPHTEAWSFVGVGPDGNTVAMGESRGSEESFTTIPAAVLLQFAEATDRDQKQFVKDVIEEFNDRKKSAYANSGQYEADSDG
jgi:hypothetical protein